MGIALFIFLFWLPLSIALTSLSDNNGQPFQNWSRKTLFSLITLPSLWSRFLQSMVYRGTVGVWLANLVHWFKS
jgi:hypothetical protein